MVSFKLVVIDLYMLIILGTFFINVLTLLYTRLPSDDTGYEKLEIIMIDFEITIFYRICSFHTIQLGRFQIGVVSRLNSFQEHLLPFMILQLHHMCIEKKLREKMYLPVGTWSPIWSSDILTDLPFVSLIEASDGKQGHKQRFFDGMYPPQRHVQLQHGRHPWSVTSSQGHCLPQSSWNDFGDCVIKSNATRKIKCIIY